MRTNIKKANKKIITYFYEKIRLNQRKKSEIRKFRDKRRVEIYSKVKLSKVQKQEIDKLFLDNYGKKIPYTWHRHYTAFTGNFDKNYFPELLFIPEFEHYMNKNKSFASVLADKNFVSLFCKSIGIKTPRVFLSKTNGIFRNDKFEFIDYNKALDMLYDLGEAFVKPTIETSSGNGCFVINIKENKDIISNQRIDEILEKLGDDFVIQERLICHSSISKIYDKSVNTFRVMTYIWNNQICIMPVIMRIGMGGKNVDNAHTGGMFIAINDDGTLHKYAFTEFKKISTKHPDTNIVYEGYEIEHFSKVLNAAKKAHSAVPQLGIISWDFTIDLEGEPVLIEANTIAGSIWLPQIAHGCGAFKDNTEEVLQWLRKQK